MRENPDRGLVRKKSVFFLNLHANFKGKSTYTMNGEILQSTTENAYNLQFKISLSSCSVFTFKMWKKWKTIIFDLGGKGPLEFIHFILKDHMNQIIQIMNIHSFLNCFCAPILLPHLIHISKHFIIASNELKLDITKIEVCLNWLGGWSTAFSVKICI